MSRAQSSFPIMGKELRLVGGHINVHRAIAFASFARQAEVERFLHMLVAPLWLQLFSFHQLKKQMGAATRRVLFLMRHQKRRTHGVIARLLPDRSSAFPDSDAAQCSALEAMLIIG